METGFNDLTIEQYRAGAALANNAADMRAREADVFAQKMREQNTRLDVFFVQSAVDRDTDSLFHKGREYL